jgi:hypothetical protein
MQPFKILHQLHDHNEPITCIIAQGLTGNGSCARRQEEAAAGGSCRLLTGDARGFIKVYCLPPRGRADALLASEWLLDHTLEVSSFAITSLLPLPPAAASSFPRVFCGVAGPECVLNPNFTTPNPFYLF